MPLPRRIGLAFLTAVGVAPAGCAWHVNWLDSPQDPGDGIRVPKESQFASLVGAPGDAVSLVDGGPIVVTSGSTPPPVTPGRPADPPAVDPPASSGEDVFPGPKPAASPTDPFLVAAQAAWDGRPDRVADALRPLDKTSQDAVRPLLTAAATLAKGESARSSHSLTASIAQMRAALAAVERKADLRVENGRFVEFAFGYRWYTDLKPDHTAFRPGEYVWFYAEVSPLAVDPLPGGGVGTNVAYALRVSDAGGRQVNLVDKDGKRTPVVLFQVVTPKSRGSVIETHVSIGFKLPDAAELPPGFYRAELEARDVPTGRVGKQAVEFRVGGK